MNEQKKNILESDPSSQFLEIWTKHEKNCFQILVIEHPKTDSWAKPNEPCECPKLTKWRHIRGNRRLQAVTLPQSKLEVKMLKWLEFRRQSTRNLKTCIVPLNFWLKTKPYQWRKRDSTKSHKTNVIKSSKRNHSNRGGKNLNIN